MRVISGQLKSQKLLQPKNSLIRPTSDRSKEMIFSTLNSILENENRKLEDLNVLDGFCGTGALGIEALSRGAKTSTFVDNSKKSLELAKDNCKKFKLIRKSFFYNLDLTKNFKKQKSFDLFFLDPPYKNEVINKSIKLLYEKEWIISNSIGIIESRKNQEVEKFGFIHLLKKKKMGVSNFSFIKIV
ncbi:16S rRNA (guanine(966)-N(2))-methyltransferase RsmD [Rickettsiales bacterium]|nr:16S rRNA (guanine(966)-N(2))-methyltransferase RsmD [Rickettsiales bacterium]